MAKDAEKVSKLTRILPPCPCGGVTRRIDTVSRREGPISIEELDSRLFRIQSLVDYRAGFDGSLHIEAQLQKADAEAEIYRTARAYCPGVSVHVQTVPCSLKQRPMYLGKRHIAAL